ncbi:MAG: hydrolase 1, exosortase A system-associated [Pseudomonadales bacterium]|nr:hydrolase 1, exosortase A system-associated [Pseudomonadales bacterium]
MSEFMEQPVIFKSGLNSLVGIYHHHNVSCSTGVLIVVGGPQYRVGSHRQFVIMARRLSQQGIPVFRFDYKGMGDSEGSVSSFEGIQDDIKSAIDTFFLLSGGMKRVVIWGLCDGASAACLYGHKDKRVGGLILVNPWVTMGSSKAKTYIKYYYFRQLLEMDFWRRLLSGDVNIKKSLKEFANTIKISLTPAKQAKRGEVSKERGLQERMLMGIKAFNGDVLTVVSGQDLTAAEFNDLLNTNAQWRSVFEQKNLSRVDFPSADHTFSQRSWLNDMSDVTAQWVRAE